MLKVLVACEESQRVCTAFTSKQVHRATTNITTALVAEQI